MNSKRKGKRIELEFAALLRSYGFEARRGQQFSGNSDAPDVVSNVEWAHWEVKGVERLNVGKAYEQAQADAGDKVPIVAHKRNRGPWLITLAAEDFMQRFVP